MKSTPQNTCEQLKINAKVAFKLGDYGHALRIYKKLTEFHDVDAELLTKYGLTALHLQNKDGLERVIAASKLDPKDAFVKRALILAKQKHASIVKNDKKFSLLKKRFKKGLKDPSVAAYFQDLIRDRNYELLAKILAENFSSLDIEIIAVCLGALYISRDPQLNKYICTCQNSYPIHPTVQRLSVLHSIDKGDIDQASFRLKQFEDLAFHDQTLKTDASALKIINNLSIDEVSIHSIDTLLSGNTIKRTVELLRTLHSRSIKSKFASRLLQLECIDPITRINMAEIIVLERDYKLALKLLGPVKHDQLNTDDFARFLLVLSYSYEQMGQFSKSLHLLTTMTCETRPSGKLLVGYIALLIQLRKFDWIEKLVDVSSEITDGSVDTELITVLSLAYFLAGDIDRAQQLITKIISHQQFNRRIFPYSSGFIFCLKSLMFRSFETANEIPEERVFVIGDSHCLMYCHRTLKLAGTPYKCSSSLIFGAKLYHIASGKNQRVNGLLAMNLAALPSNAKVCLSLGEIDTRSDEGIVPYLLRTNRVSHDEICVYLEQLVSSYIQNLKKILAERNPDLELFIIGIPAPIISATEENADLRSFVIKTLNHYLRELSYSENFGFLDVYELTTDSDGGSNLIFHSDRVHLSPATLERLAS
ncbi:hypothetical protein N9W46_08500 [Litoricolaceae bacterium]|nr:hypothetical protein [Litorivicinaceae bacterium]